MNKTSSLEQIYETGNFDAVIYITQIILGADVLIYGI